MLGRVRWERSMSVYEAPRLSELGSIRELTQQQFNKVGSSPRHIHPGHRRNRHREPRQPAVIPVS